MMRNPSHNFIRGIFAPAMLGVVFGVMASGALAQLADQVPEELEGVGVTEHLKEKIPLDLEFTNAEGKAVSIGEYFDGERPVILNLGYFRCPMLCGLVVNGMTDAMKEMPWTPGKEFQIVTVSIDPLETSTLAKLKKQNYLKDYGRPAAAGGWHFLTGKEKNIQALTDAVGFHFKWNDERQEFAHTAVLTVLTPDGEISRYLYGVMFDPQTLRLSLAEASEGKVGSTVDKVLLFCFQYDPEEGSYALAAMNLMRAGGVLTLLILGVGLFIFWRRELRHKTNAEAGSLSS